MGVSCLKPPENAGGPLNFTAHRAGKRVEYEPHKAGGKKRTKRRCRRWERQMKFRVKSIDVTNFKSLVDFHLDMNQFTCLIGLNGSGKSTVLQFVDFLAQLMRGDMKGWLEKRGWKSSDLRSKLISKMFIRFRVEFEDAEGQSAGHWAAVYSPQFNRCREEVICLNDDSVELDHGNICINGGEKQPVLQKFEGSILSTLEEKLLPSSICGLKSFFEGFESLELMTPERLRERTRAAAGSLGHGGRNLAAFIFEHGSKGRILLRNQLKQVYPQFSHFSTKSLRSGWKQLQVGETFDGKLLVTEARHLNDGMLRLIAVLAELASEHHFLLFDEIENGINPELVEFVTDALVKARQQVLVTTHSPMILNYLEDEVARKSVVYLYKNKQGHTRSVPFFSIPSLKEKLTVMGPGEAFVDTDLTKLGKEIARLQPTKKSAPEAR
jgi:predicted ATPase